MTSNKSSFFAGLYRKVGEGLGWLDAGKAGPTTESGNEERTEADRREAREAIAVLKAYHKKVVKAGVTEEDIRSWIRDGRRSGGMAG